MMEAAISAAAPGPLTDPKVIAVIDRLQAERRRPPRGGPRRADELDPHAYEEFGFSIHPEQGDLIYLLCRAIGARRVVEFATSIGMSTLYFAAAIRDNGGGKVIGSDIVPGKLAAARRNLAAAGLAAWVELRPGDARDTLRDLGGPVDVALIDGWPGREGPSLARQMMEIITPQLRIGGIVINDNAEPDYLDYIRDPANGFCSMSLPLKGGTELSVKLSEPSRG
jgi:predicted O-methyltransferase YrrM